MLTGKIAEAGDYPIEINVIDLFGEEHYPTFTIVATDRSIQAWSGGSNDCASGAAYGAAFAGAALVFALRRGRRRAR